MVILFSENSLKILVYTVYLFTNPLYSEDLTQGQFFKQILTGLK